MENKKKHIQVYTDGSYDWGREVGGYGAVVFLSVNGVNRMKKYNSTVSYVDTTSNRMEIRAILAAIKTIDPGWHIDLYSDSTYCVNQLNKISTRRNTGSIEANKDLWEQVSSVIKNHRAKGTKFNFSWIRAHAGNPFNEMADKLAYTGANREKKVVCDQTKKPETH